MTQNARTGHPSQDILLDFAEGEPVDASWADHISGCESCSVRVGEMHRALTAARDDVDVPDPGKKYWEDFGSRLHEQISAESEKRTVWSRRRWWAVAASVLLALVGWLAWEATRPSTLMSEITSYTLLPPAEQDQEFQFLLSFAEAVYKTEDLEDFMYLVGYSALDPDQLTKNEQEQLREELENLLKAEENEIS
jgi:hypothetical protein